MPLSTCHAASNRPRMKLQDLLRIKRQTNLPKDVPVKQYQTRRKSGEWVRESVEGDKEASHESLTFKETQYSLHRLDTGLKK